MADPVVRIAGDLGFSVESDGAIGVSLTNGELVASGMQFIVRLVDGRFLRPDAGASVVEAREGLVKTRIRLGNGALEVRADWTFDGVRVDGTATIHNLGAEPLALDRVLLCTLPDGLAIDGEPARWSFYKMGWNVASASGFLPFTAAESQFFMRLPFRWLPSSVRHMMYNEGTSFSDRPGEFQSEWLGAFAGPGGKTLVCGFAGSGRHFSQVVASAPDAFLRLEALMDGAMLLPGAEKALEPILFLSADDPDTALQGYARAVAVQDGARVNPIRLWCSWYSGFYDRVTEEAFVENARLARAADVPVEYFQLDDGYQRCVGDWLITNDRFPSGLAALAATIADLGFQPGIWTAPFALSRKCQAFVDHPDWVVADRRGRPVPAGFIMGKFGPRYYYGLDTTRPEVIEWIETLYRTLRAMGWRLFKVDFLTAASVPGVRHDPTVTRAEAYRRGLEAVRRGVGDDALLLSGIGPVLGNAGLMDIQRLGPDTSFGGASWRNRMQRWMNDRMTPGFYNNSLGSLARSFTDGILWSGDGDALIQQGAPAGEARTQAAIALLCGGTLSLGHDYRKGPFDLEIVRELAGRTGPARVPDRVAGPVPRQVFTDGLFEGRPVRWLALANLDDTRTAVAPHPEALPGGNSCEAVETGTGATVLLDPACALAVEGRGVRLFRITLPAQGV
jgi:hypothetical protein